jgi:hypothetical protein
VFLTHDTVRHVDSLVDPLGVLSVYLGSRDRGERPMLSQAVRLGARLQALATLGRDPAVPERGAALRAALGRLRPLLARQATRRGGRGRAAFARLSGDEVWEVETAMPLRTTAALEPTGYVRPLVAALDDGRPAGVVLAGPRRLRALDWRMGILRTVAELPRAPGDAVAGQLAELVREHEWRRLVVEGEPRLAGALLAAGPPLRGCHLAIARRPLGALAAERLEPAVADELEAVQRRMEVALVCQAVDASRHSGEAVLGMEAAARALGAGRLSHLLFDNERDRLGWPGEGLVEAGLPIDPAERLIELALDGAAAITPLEGRAALALRSAGGVAALLRW